MSWIGSLISRMYRRGPTQPGVVEAASLVWADPVHRSRIVRLLPGHRPVGEAECCLHVALSNGPVPLGILIDHVADRLLHAEIARGGWACGVGMLGAEVYKPEVAEALMALDGVMVHIQLPVAGTGGSHDQLSD